MSSELPVLAAAAASIGFFHTLLGPDHYLPFIVMNRAGKWSLRKTAVITLLCGAGHVLSSVVLGIIGIVFGVALAKLEVIESVRGSLAAWLLIAFGLLYFVWGMRRALKQKSHEHPHVHAGGIQHVHVHNHSAEHVHIHNRKGTKNLTPWILFTIFVFGPCEPLIPLLMYPAAKNSIPGLVLVTAVFGIITVVTMMGVVLVSTFSANLIPTARLEKYTHAIAGAAICLSGMAIQFLGL
jgi:sulfite exporter TauE/SafE